MEVTKNILGKYGNPSESGEHLFTLLKEMIEKELERLSDSTSKLDQTRIIALNRVLKTGLPNKKWKGWAYTELKWWVGDTFSEQNINSSHKIQSSTSRVFGEFFILILNGEVQIQQSRLPKNISITKLQDIEQGKHIDILNNPRLKTNTFVQLNCGLVKRGFLLNAVKDGAEKPIEIFYLNDANNDNSCFHQMHNIYMLGPNSKLTIVERFWRGDDELFCDKTKKAYFNNTVSQSFLSAGSQLTKYSLGDLTGQTEMCKSVNTDFVQQKENSVSVLYKFYFSKGKFKCDGTIRNNIQIEFDERNAKCDINSISMLSNKTHVDNNIIVKHNKANNKSSQVFKGVYSGSSRGVFDSCVVVKKDAQKTQTIQKNNNILLSEKASINTNPQLEIFADDVECAHGSTIGQLDPSALFYLASRGLSREIATNLLLSGFVNDVTKNIQDESVKKELLTDLNKQLNL